MDKFESSSPFEGRDIESSIAELQEELKQNRISFEGLSGDELERVLHLGFEAASEGSRFRENMVYNVESVRDELASEVGEEDIWGQEQRFTRKLQSANKAFLFGAFSEIRCTAAEEQKKEKAWAFSRKFIGFSEDMMNYAGDLEDYIDLYMAIISDKTLSQAFGGPLAASMEYDMSIYGSDEVGEVFSSGSPAKVAIIMPLIEQIATNAKGWGYGDKFFDKTLTDLVEVQNNADSAFLRLVAEAMQDWMRDSSEYLADDGTKWVDVATLPKDEQDRILTEAEAEKSKRTTEWQTLQKQLNADTTINKGGIINNERLLLETLHRKGMRDVVEDELGLNLANLSLGSKRHLLKLMVESDSQQYDKLKFALEKVEDRTQFAESFLALDFGQDFSEALLTNAETTPVEVFQECLSSIDKIRKSAGQFSEIFGKFDQNLAQSVENAIGERVTEVLYALKAVNAADGGPVSRKMFGKFDKTVSGYEDITDALDILEQTIYKINRAAASRKVEKLNYHGEASFYRLGAGDVLLKTREYGTNTHGDPATEFTADFNGGKVAEAQINFWVNVLEDDQPLGLDSKDDPRVVSLRIDREKKAVRSPAGGVIECNAEIEQSTAALDIGSNFGDPQARPETLLGTVIAVGNLVRSPDGKGYHSALPEEYGQKETFADLARHLSQEFVRRGQVKRLGRWILRGTSWKIGKTAA